MGISLEQLTNSVNKVMTKVKDKFVLKEEGKGLSTNDYSTEDKSKVAKIDNIESSVKNVSSQIDEKTTFYNSVSHLKNSNVKQGQMITTLGFYSAGDGGGATYKIRKKTDADIDNGGSIIIGSLIAELIVKDGMVNLKQFGAKGDGVTDDTKKFQDAITFAQTFNYMIKVPNGNNFLITDSISLIPGKHINITGDGSEQSQLMGSVISFNPSIGKTMMTIPSGICGTIKNIHFYSNSGYMKINENPIKETTPYEWYTYITNVDKVNCIIDNSLSVSYHGCTFRGFSGFAIQPAQHHIFYDCRFRDCNYAIFNQLTDCVYNNCWFTHCVEAMYNDSTNLGTAIEVWDCWFDQIQHHAIHMEKALHGRITGLFDHIGYAGICAGSSSNLIIDARMGRNGSYYGGTNAETLYNSSNTREENFDIMRKSVFIAIDTCNYGSFRIGTQKISQYDTSLDTFYLLPSVLCYGYQWKSTTIDFADNVDDINPLLTMNKTFTNVKVLRSTLTGVTDGTTFTKDIDVNGSILLLNPTITTVSGVSCTVSIPMASLMTDGKNSKLISGGLLVVQVGNSGKTVTALFMLNLKATLISVQGVGTDMQEVSATISGSALSENGIQITFSAKGIVDGFTSKATLYR